MWARGGPPRGQQAMDETGRVSESGSRRLLGMHGSLFDRLQGIVRGHLMYAWAAAVLPCGGCFSCTGIPVYTRPDPVLIQVPQDVQAALLTYAETGGLIPTELCNRLCVPASTGRSGHPAGCALPKDRGDAKPDERVGQLVCDYLRREVMAAGRRPGGMVDESACRPTESIASWLARAATLEAAACVAFGQLTGELEALSAPPALTLACRSAQADERRHAALMGSLARRAGSIPRAPVILPQPLRSPLAIACHNAVEGCVRECFGAIEALWQSQTAEDATLRGAMATIAHEEAAHAELSFALHAWLMSRLSPPQQRLVRDIRQVALTEFLHALRVRTASDDERALGLPRGPAAAALLHDAMTAVQANPSVYGAALFG